MDNEIIGNLKAYRNSIRGKINKASGAMFERLIEKSCNQYAAQGIAKIEKQAEPVHYIRPIGNSSKFIANYAKKSGADYKGTLKGGQSICIEAKFTDTDKFAYNRVEEHQLQYLYEHYKMGAQCYILVSFALEDFFRIPFTVWYNMKAIFGRRYIARADDKLEEYRVPYKQGYIEFLRGVANDTQNKY